MQKNSNTLRPMDGIACECILVYLDCFKYNEINKNFFLAQKHLIHNDRKTEFLIPNIIKSKTYSENLLFHLYLNLTLLLSQNTYVSSYM